MVEKRAKRFMDMLMSIKHARTIKIFQNYFPLVFLVMSICFILIAILMPENRAITKSIFFSDIRKVFLAYIVISGVYIKIIKKLNITQYLSKRNMSFACCFILFGLLFKLLASYNTESLVADDILSILMGNNSKSNSASLGTIFLSGGVLLLFLCPLQKKSKKVYCNHILFVGVIFSLLCFLSSLISLPLFNQNIDSVNRMMFGFTKETATIVAYKYALIYLYFLGYYLTLGRNKTSIVLMLVIGLLMGLSIFITGTRAAILLVFGISLILIFSRKKISIKYLMGLLVLFLSLVAILYPRIIQPRLNSTITEYKSQSKNGSIYLRITSWDASFKTLQNKVWKGGGQTRKNIIKSEIVKKNYGEEMTRIHHAHNDYLEAGATLGLLAPVGIILFYLSLLIMTFKLKLLSLSLIIIAMGVLGLWIVHYSACQLETFFIFYFA